MKFCTCHNSHTVVMCAKFRCDQLSTFQARALQILIKFQIQLKCHLWDGGQVMSKHGIDIILEYFRFIAMKNSWIDNSYPWIL